MSNSYLPDDLLAKIDIATMAYSLEGRSPLLDHELMELAASLPPELKAARGQRKRILRSALRGWIPDEILDGPKRGFRLPVARWLREDLRGLRARGAARSRRHVAGLVRAAARCAGCWMSTPPAHTTTGAASGRC